MALAQKDLFSTSNELVDMDEKQIQELLQNEVQQALGNIDPRPPRVKISRESQAFLLPDGSTQKVIEGVVVFHHKARGFWEIEGQQAPTCSSMDGITGTDQNGITRPCAGCPRDAWGTGKDGRGKACKEMRWIYVLQEGEIIPSRISLPPTSLGQFDAFVTALAQKRLAPIQKITRLGLEKTERHGFTYSVLGQPEVTGDTPLQNIPGLIKMREAVVQAARKEGITAEDYYGEGEDVPDTDQPY